VSWISVLVAILPMVGCSSDPPPTVDQMIGRRMYSGSIWTVDGMYLVARGPGALFIADPPLRLNDYRGVMLDEIQISTKEGSRDLKPTEEEWLRASFRRGLLRLFDQRDWSPQPDADVLRVRLAVTEVEFQRRTQNVGSSLITGVRSDQSITIILELRDSVERSRVLVFGEKTELPFGTYSGVGEVGVKRVKDAFREFTRDARRHLAAAKRGDYPPPPPI
jgi:hypothetical protein